MFYLAYITKIYTFIIYVDFIIHCISCKHFFVLQLMSQSLYILNINNMFSVKIEPNSITYADLIYFHSVSVSQMVKSMLVLGFWDVKSLDNVCKVDWRLFYL